MNNELMQSKIDSIKEGIQSKLSKLQTDPKARISFSLREIELFTTALLNNIPEHRLVSSTYVTTVTLLTLKYIPHNKAQLSKSFRDRIIAKIQELNSQPPSALKPTVYNLLGPLLVLVCDTELDLMNLEMKRIYLAQIGAEKSKANKDIQITIDLHNSAEAAKILMESTKNMEISSEYDNDPLMKSLDRHGDALNRLLDRMVDFNIKLKASIKIKPNQIYILNRIIEEYFKPEEKSEKLL